MNAIQNNYKNYDEISYAMKISLQGIDSSA
jgi:hypothetical protein